MFNTDEERYVFAEYQSQRGGGEWVYRLRKEVGGSRRAIVQPGMRGNVKNTKKPKELFLLRQAESGNWMAALWSKNENPWLIGNTPQSGDTVEGIVRNINKNGSVAFVDFVHDEKTHNGKVYSSRLPSFVEEYSVSSVLEPGDLVSGVIYEIDIQDLQFSMDVDRWYSDQLDRWRSSAARAYQNQITAKGKIYSDFAPISATRRDIQGTLLVVDDDEELCLYASAFFSSRGMTVLTSTNSSEKGIQESVYRNIRHNPDYILTDYQITDNTKISQEILSTIEAYKGRNPAAKIVMLSGNFDDAEAYARELGFHFFQKPFPLWKIASWFESEFSETKKIERTSAFRSTHSFFAVEGQHKKIIAEAENLLKKVCDKFEYWGAFWVLRNPAASYEVRAATENVDGYLSRGLISQFKHSMIEDFTMGEDIQSFQIHSNDPLAKGLPNDVRFGLAVPITYEVRFPRCIVFLSTRPIQSNQENYVRDREDHFALLVRGISQAEVIDEVAASAQQGRIAFATLHEIRTEVQKISNAVHSERPPQERIDRISTHLTEAERLISGELTRFKAGESEKNAIGEIITRTTSKMQLYLDDKSVGHSPRILVELDDRAATLKLPFSVALERTLVNLIDNAADFLKSVSARYIWVQLRYMDDCDEYPIEISVRDTGPGISFSDIESVFSPRKSGRTELSTGLGLFISRELIEMLGGKIAVVHRSKWAGTEFKIQIPYLVG